MLTNKKFLITDVALMGLICFILYLGFFYHWRALLKEHDEYFKIKVNPA
jgi:hypothetical protein